MGKSTRLTGILDFPNTPENQPENILATDISASQHAADLHLAIAGIILHGIDKIWLQCRLKSAIILAGW
jgi:hypothetical protein